VAIFQNLILSMFIVINTTLAFIAISGIAAALVLATIVPVQVSADRSSGQQGVSKTREASCNTRSCGGLNEASSHTSGSLLPCPPR
jgi:type IV secretory pathway component VirB8